MTAKTRHLASVAPPAKKAAAKKAAKKAPARPAAKKAPAKKAPPAKKATAPRKRQPDAELTGITTEIPYADAPKVHWKFFRDISVAYASQTEGISGARYDNKTMTIVVAGTVAARKAVAKALPDLWKKAELALRMNDRARADEIKKLNKTPQGRRSRIPAEGEFLEKYCDDMIAAGLL